MLVAVLLVGGKQANAQQFNFMLLHSFGYFDGSTPSGRLTIDSAGNLYGTAAYGGPIYSGGVVWEITARGNFKILHNFNGVSTADGELRMLA